MTGQSVIKPFQGKSFSKMAWILGDQLNLEHSWFSSKDADTLFVIAELRQELQYTRHHVQKVCAFFAAMRAFADELSARGHKLLYIDLDASGDYENLSKLIESLCRRFRVEEFHYQRPDEFRLLEQFRNLKLPNTISVSEADTEHFLLPFDELGDAIEVGRHNRMETFYRKLRRRFNILMNGDKPAGGRWNFDAENRNKLKEKDLSELPAPLTFKNDVRDILRSIDAHEVNTIGTEQEDLIWPIDRNQARELLAWFCDHALENFGRFQDAMTRNSEHKWSLYHSRLSFALNSKILSPREVIEAAITAYERESSINLAQVEGFVRQILGWREFVRAIYWVNGAEYKNLNHFDAGRELPKYFWNGETKMQCMSESINQSIDSSYAHHIQRLMVTGNFCMLTGIDPDQVDEWYLGIYIDAIEWVELPNTRGMSQFADGGLIATKPYAASGNYINKMSDYCSKCHYKVKDKSGELACPFNGFYWHFMTKHRRELAKNSRIGMLFGNWDRKEKSERDEILATAESNLRQLDTL